ncbi:uncharacterized protein Z519_12086 [Cladophialophora bantiana CBS 173.52]|uniref:Uncharacterized protein n=1 Tax=Cladophialophora bantiana (strain ATCC 10958 / CBS 173.52 / CDC B-1940 / NIH 8579) TaxID=1442370 RepID=A0A0D2H991_CLAB1|nr:uncharacterized protein Z519_12086 [Cladophialophora bantiana CBS 173.52]KIW87450.1 hypothetical protein Z519_12086 [Cladophialophora bantiana CBS 173.52]
MASSHVTSRSQLSTQLTTPSVKEHPPCEPIPSESILSREGISWVLHVDDKSPKPEALNDVQWEQCSVIVVRINPLPDSPTGSTNPMVDFNHAPTCMTSLVNRVGTVSSLMKNKLHDHINAGQKTVQVVFGEC